MHVQIVTQMVTFVPWVLFISRIYGHFFCRDAGVLSVIFISGDPFISGFPGPSYLSVGIRLFQDSPGRFR